MITSTDEGFCKNLTLSQGSEARLPKGFLIGHAQDKDAATGCSVILCKNGATGAVSVRGAAPASIETDLLCAKRTVQKINGVMLSGGSAFGLEAASGAMKWLSENNVGFEVGDIKVPIVSGASIFDLGVGSNVVFPDKNMGYQACRRASRKIFTGNFGAGIGASVGKLLGSEFAMKGGFGAASIAYSDVVVTAVVVVNAVGNIVERNSKKALAGTIDPQTKKTILSTQDLYATLAKFQSDTLGQAPALARNNTTIGCILTNANLEKAQAAHIADMTHDGLARAIEPVHTGFDGDALFVMSYGEALIDANYLGMLSAWACEEAIYDAVINASSAYGLPCANDFN